MASMKWHMLGAHTCGNLQDYSKIIIKFKKMVKKNVQSNALICQAKTQKFS